MAIVWIAIVWAMVWVAIVVAMWGVPVRRRPGPAALGCAV
ncbi:hypothetical protein FBY26_1457 [Phycicoccus sp. SLBN-51]|nr:hypothetical protein FBY26_1457 [Phycicoccus sp. SLBN-51]